jgi:hypothetical protein
VAWNFQGNKLMKKVPSPALVVLSVIILMNNWLKRDLKSRLLSVIMVITVWVDMMAMSFYNVFRLIVIEVLIFSIISVCLILLTIYFLGLTKSERHIVKNQLMKIKLKIHRGGSLN